MKNYTQDLDQFLVPPPRFSLHTPSSIDIDRGASECNNAICTFKGEYLMVPVKVCTWLTEAVVLAADGLCVATVTTETDSLPER